MLTMAESPTGTTAANTQMQSPAYSSPKEPSEPSTTTSQVKREGSPRSPKQNSLYHKRAGRRHKPYPDRSPGGSTCSSDESNGESDDTEIVRQSEQRRVKRLAANTRERKRMHTVNSAFEQLRDLVPTYPSNRKLSKIDTLRLACTYIQDLVSLLHNTHTLQPTEDCIYHPAIPDAYIPNGYTGLGVKSEISDFPSFTQYRMQPSVSFLFTLLLATINKCQVFCLVFSVRVHLHSLCLSKPLFLCKLPPQLVCICIHKYYYMGCKSNCNLLCLFISLL